MNAGKSTMLLQASHNYRERGMHTIILTSSFDDRSRIGEVASRIGLKSEASLFSPGFDIAAFIEESHREKPIACLLVDEAQFLDENQVWQLCKIVDQLDIPVMCYGLRTDFQGKLFPGSAALLSIADEMREIKTICWCGAKATMVIRMDENGDPILDGDQVVIGGNDRYISLCRSHWAEKNLGPSDPGQPKLALD